MKHLSHNKKGFSIVLALGLALLLSYTGLYLLEYMVPFSRNIKGIENASKAFYESYGGVEDALYDVATGDIGDEASGVTAQGYEYDIIGMGGIIPSPGTGNSDFDAHWNTLSMSDPVQLLVGKNRLNSGGSDRIRISLRIPDFDGNGSSDTLDIGGGPEDIILWQLTSASDAISTRDGEFITETDLNSGITEGNLWSDSVGSYGQGVLNDGTDESFRGFYTSNPSACNNISNECVLKISIINPLISSSNNSLIPYIEYQIHTDTNIPLRYTQVISQGTSFGYTKILNVAIAQQTTNAAFDFTVFQ